MTSDLVVQLTCQCEPAVSDLSVLARLISGGAPALDPEIAAEFRSRLLEIVNSPSRGLLEVTIGRVESGAAGAGELTVRFELVAPLRDLAKALRAMDPHAPA